MNDTTEFWAVLEGDDATHEQNAELLGEVLACARRTRQQQAEPVEVCAILLRAPEAELPSLAGLRGVQRLYLHEHQELKYYTTGAYVEALRWLLSIRRPPTLIALSAAANGRDLAARLATRLRLPLAPNCLSLDIRSDAIFALQALYEGRAYAQTRTRLVKRPALATIATGRRGVPAIDGHEPEVVHYEPALEPPHRQIRRLALQAPSPDEVELEEAERIVAGGRGIGREGFTELAEFAHLLGAAVGASRVASDQGWIEQSRQIGATGKTVRPQLYIACGISGAAQHTSGISEAQTVVAINPDRHAPIIALADLGLLGDANQVLSLAASMLKQEDLAAG